MCSDTKTPHNEQLHSDQWSCTKEWIVWYDEDCLDTFIGFRDEDGTQLIIASMDLICASHIATLHNEWLARTKEQQ